MASFRTGIKIISDVSKRQGRVLLQRSFSSEYMVALRGKRSASGSRSTSSPGDKEPEDQHDMTQLVVDETVSWFAPFTTRQGKRETRAVSQPQTDSSRAGRKFLLPDKGPQTPNRYYSAATSTATATAATAAAAYCRRDPPSPFEGPHPSERDCHKDNSKPCFQDNFKPKKIIKEDFESGVTCGGKKMLERSGRCQKQKAGQTFVVCPKPVANPPIFKCPEAPKKPRSKKIVSLPDPCEELKPTFKICPKPPPRKMLPMCLVLSGKLKENTEKAVIIPKPPPTPRRCLCEGDPEFEEMNRPPPLYKLNPDVPFTVCPKNASYKIETLKWDSTNKQCQGKSQGSCSTSDGGRKKTDECKSITGGPCVEFKSCPFRPSPPPQKIESSCGPGSKPAAPSEPSASITLSNTAFAPAPKAQAPPAPPKSVSSSAAEPKKVQSLTSVSKPSSAAAPLGTRQASSATSIPKQCAPNTSSTAGGGSSKQSFATSSNKSSKNEKDAQSSGGTCKKISLPGCGKPLRKYCADLVNTRKPCVKIPVPTPCFTDCYKGPCPPKMCNPCPCVHVVRLTECFDKNANKHLQPRSKMFEKRKKFIVPAPEVEVVIDPMLVACCEPDNTPAPKPLTCEPATSVDRTPSTKCTPEQTEGNKSGCDCSVVKFISSLMSYLRGEGKNPGPPPAHVLKAAQAMDEGQEQCTSGAGSVNNATVSPSSDRGKKPSAPKKGKKDKKDKKSNKTSGQCQKLKLPGCGQPLRDDCSVETPESQCTKTYPPRPSFSECVRNEFPQIKCTECRIAMKRARSLVELRNQGIRITPETLRTQCNKCLFPMTRSCETFTLTAIRPPTRAVSLDDGTTARASESKNPPRPTRDCAGPSGGAMLLQDTTMSSLPRTDIPSYESGMNPECPDPQGECYEYEPYRLPK